MRLTKPPRRETTLNLCDERGVVLRLINVPSDLILDAKVIKCRGEFYAHSSGIRYTRTKMVELQLSSMVA